MRKRIFQSILIIIAIFLLSVIAVFLLAKIKPSGFNIQKDSKDTQQIAVSDLADGQSIQFGEEDYVFVPEERHIVTDEETGIVFCNNLLNVYLKSSLDEKAAQKIADLVNGKIGGYIHAPINLLQILIPETSLNELTILAQQLNKDDRVLLACEEIPVQIERNTYSSVAEVLADDQNPWTYESTFVDKGNEANPAGNDWWAEAIGAYTAWKYDDLSNQFENPDDKIKIGVLDSGYYQDKLVVDDLHLYPEGLQTPDLHGTAVVRIMAERNDEWNIRGIFDHAVVYASDFDVKNGSSDTNYINNGFFTVLLKMQLDKGVKVINNSWGSNDTLLSYEEYERLVQWENDEYKNKTGYQEQVATKEEYQKLVRNNAARINSWTRSCLMFMLQELRSSTGSFASSSDFVIVQSAGNGSRYDNTACEAEANGGFCMITEDFYNNLFDEASRTRLMEEGVTFDEIQKRIAVVAAVRNKDEAGQYRLSNSSGYGKQVTLCAPGEDIFFGLVDRSQEKDVPEDRKRVWQESGTSLAAPMVTASIGYLLSLDPDLTAPEALQLLIDTANVAYPAQNSSDYREDYPMLNIGKAVTMLMGKVENNGGNVVGYQNRVYYWRLSPEAMTASGQNYFTFNANAASELICRSQDGTERVLLTDCAQGPIYISGEYLYYERTFNSWGVYHIPTGQVYSRDGDVFGVDTLRGGYFVKKSYDVYYCSPGNEDVLLPFDSTQILGIFEDGLYICSEDDLGMNFFRFKNNFSDAQKLGSIPYVNLIDTYIADIIHGKDCLFLNIGRIQGTGLFYTGQLYKVSCEGDGITTLVSGTANDTVGFRYVAYADTEDGEFLYYYGGESLANAGASYSYNGIDWNVKRVDVSSGTRSDSDFALDWNGSIVSDNRLLYRGPTSQEYQEILNVNQLPDGFDSLGERILPDGTTKYTIPYRVDVVYDTEYVTLLEMKKSQWDVSRYITFERGTSKMISIRGDAVQTVFDFTPR